MLANYAYCFWFFHNSTKLLSLASKWRFEQQSYIEQQEFNTSLVLTCFAVVIGLFGVFSFYNVSQSLKDNIAEIDDKIKNAVTKQRQNNIDQSKKYNDIKHGLNRFKIRFIDSERAFYQDAVFSAYHKKDSYSLVLNAFHGLKFAINLYCVMFHRCNL